MVGERAMIRAEQCTSDVNKIEADQSLLIDLIN